ncbi:unnamed protein product [Microthlaspi erraticum]|uniref:Uncharacterized protein n=1 Tax=Microthlaspi erraticum TaxID=1685480 RepID=A0A6D2KP75_9BRAS|nr:unnamed protein product [Microthlaspi erraticum]
MDIKFCKTNLSLSTRSWMGVPIQVHTSIGWPSKLLLPNPELTTIELRIELRTSSVNEDLGEPECYYFEEYEAPRMNPSVVAATRGLDFSKVQQVARESHGKMQKSMDKMVSKIKSLEKKVSGSSSKKKKSKAPLSLGVSLLTTQGGSLPKSLTEPLLSSQGKERQHAEKEEEFQDAPRSTTGLDRVQTEETQLDRAEGRVDLEEPLFENPGFEYDQPSTRTSLRAGPLQPLRASTAPPRPRKPHTLKMKKKRRRSHKLDRVSRTQLQWSAPDGRLPSPDHDLASQFFGGTEAKFGGANSSSIELGVKTRKVVFWSILEHMGHKEHGGTWHMEQLNWIRKGRREKPS